jgi:hypothetical protein
VLPLRGGAALARQRLTIKHGQTATVTLKLKPSALRKLKGNKRKRTKVTLELANRRLSLAATVQQR